MQVFDFVSHKRKKSLKADIVELKEIIKAVKSTLNTLTKYDKYNKIRRITGDLLETYQDLKQVVHTKEQILVTLEIRTEDE